MLTADAWPDTASTSFLELVNIYRQPMTGMAGMVANAKSSGRKPRALLLVRLKRVPLWGLELYYILCRWTLLAVDDLKSHALTFAEGFETFGQDCRMMDKNILAAILLDKAETFCIIKPFHCSLCHCLILLCNGDNIAPFSLPECIQLPPRASGQTEPTARNDVTGPT